MIISLYIICCNRSSVCIFYTKKNIKIILKQSINVQQVTFYDVCFRYNYCNWRYSQMAKIIFNVFHWKNIINYLVTFKVYQMKIKWILVTYEMIHKNFNDFAIHNFIIIMLLKKIMSWHESIVFNCLIISGKKIYLTFSKHVNKKINLKYP